MTPCRHHYETGDKKRRIPEISGKRKDKKRAAIFAASHFFLICYSAFLRSSNFLVSLPTYLLTVFA